MKTFSEPQGSELWLLRRLGIVTASGLDRLITPAYLEWSESQGVDRYVAECCAGWVLQQPLDDSSGAFARRGTDLESEAVSYYESHYNTQVERVGFCVTDDYTFGASPDGIVGGECGLEIKCKSPTKFWLDMRNLDRFRADHRLQCIGGMWATGCEMWHLISYHPSIAPFMVRVDFVADDEDVQQVFALLDENIPTLAERINLELAEAGYDEIPACGSKRMAYELARKVEHEMSDQDQAEWDAAARAERERTKGAINSVEVYR